MNKFILKFKFNWNNFLLKIKFKEIKKCDAYIMGEKKCNKLTYFRFCDNHHKTYKEECEKYHMYKKYDTYNIINSLVEYHQRQNFCKKYNIKPDIGHKDWSDFLYNNWKDDYKIIDDYIIDKKYKEADLMLYFGKHMFLENDN
jgi:hypothetical protein